MADRRFCGRDEIFQRRVRRLPGSPDAIEVDEIPVFSAEAVKAVWKRPVKNKNSSMKKITLLTLAVTMLAGLTLTAADDAAPKRKPPTAEEIKKYDKDGDGKLSKEERAALNADRKKDKKDAK